MAQRRVTERKLVVPFTDAELELIEEAAGEQPAVDFVREVVLGVVQHTLAPDGGEDGEAHEPDDDGLATGEMAEVIDRLDQIIRQNREIIRHNREQVLLTRSTLGELMAHTRYADEEHRKACEAQAGPRFRRVEERIRQMLDFDDTPAPNGEAN